ncbi:hypothetical protein WJX75_000730 [Coccomyxa subellipsoidea]|uniref:Protein kinase domain-containing protein n=1 Tax=Coccomyxa subellipsoidea TaxID=248742 RepID=A0ABR2YC67_9CHLO
MQVATFLRKKSVFPDIRSIFMDMGRADSQPLQKQLKDLKDGRANDEATIMMLRTQVAAVQATAVQEGNAAQETIESLQAQVAALEHDKTAAEEQTTRAKAKMTRAAAVRMEMKAVLQRREAELQKAEKKLHDTLHNSNETQRKFEILKAELDRKTRELEKAGALTERVAAYARDLESEREALEEQLEESRNAIPVIKEADCKFLRQLGEGATATVDLFSVELAVKRPKTKEEAERLEEEASTMASLHHPGLPAPVCWIEPADGRPCGLAMPLIRSGTLHSRIWGPAHVKSYKLNSEPINTTVHPTDRYLD